MEDAYEQEDVTDMQAAIAEAEMNYLHPVQLPGVTLRWRGIFTNSTRGHGCDHDRFHFVSTARYR